MLFLQIVFLTFEVFGVFCAIVLLCEWLFASPQVVVAIELHTPEDAADLAYLLEEVQHTAIRRGSGRIVVLIAQPLMEGTLGMGTELYASVMELIDRYDADCYLIE